MLDIHFTATELGNFADIFTRPFTVQEYETAPELVAMHHIAPPEPLASETPVYILGKTPSQSSHSFRVSAVPEMQIAELQDVFLYNMVAHSQTGNFFTDSARTFTQRPTGRSYRFPFPKGAHPTNLGCAYYCHTEVPPYSEAAVFHECAMPFFTYEHYGHFLVDCLPQLWVLDHGFKPKLILHPSMLTIPDYLLEMVAPFGLNETDFIYASQFSIFKKLILPNRAYMNYRYISQHAKNIYNRIRDYYYRKDSSSLDKIYISREKVSSRSLRNEAQCRKMFERYGFTTVFSEDLSIEEKVTVFANASHVAGPAGSGLHAVLFSRKPDEVSLLPLSPREFPSTSAFYCMEQSYGRQSNIVFGDNRVRLMRVKSVQNLQGLCYKEAVKTIAAQGDFEHGPYYYALLSNAISNSQTCFPKARSAT